MNALLLSAGFGTRFKPHTEITAKPTIPFINLPLIGYSLYYANKWNCKNIIVNTHHLPKSVENCANKLSQPFESNLKFIHETPYILDSGGGIKNAENSLNMNDTFLVFNTDIPHILPNFDFTELKEQHLQSNSLVTLLTCDLENLGTKIKGLWTKKNSNKVEDIGIGPKQNLICRHYSGVMLISKKLLELQPPHEPHNIIYDVILPAISEGHNINTFHIDNLNWFETGNLESYLNASFEVVNKLAEEPQSSFAIELNNIFRTFGIKNNIISDVDFKLVYEEAFTNSGAGFKGSIVLGKNIDLTRVHSLDNSVIYSNSNLTKSSYSRVLVL